MILTRENEVLREIPFPVPNISTNAALTPLYLIPILRYDSISESPKIVVVMELKFCTYNAANLNLHSAVL